MRWLVDGDVANNSGNWQWVAGTGNDTRPYRRLNPLRQAERFDPDGDYVRGTCRSCDRSQVATSTGRGDLDDSTRRALDYPAPIVDDPPVTSVMTSQAVGSNVTSTIGADATSSSTGVCDRYHRALRCSRTRRRVGSSSTVCACALRST